ncbi:MAG: PaaI family thioesterase [Hyphomicrobiaceae bacterium]|nr:PaaI family thioesterase [Hyphomicrobiaceae bacterium]
MSNFPGLEGRTFGVTPVETVRKLSGLEFLQGLIDGTLPVPPIGRAMGFLLKEVKPGYACFTCTPTFEHYNPIGSVHGGLAGTLLDSCMSCAVQTNLAAGQGYTTLEYRVHLVRGMTDKTGEVRAEGRVVHAGRRTSTAEGRIVDANGKLYAHGTTTCIVLDL